MASAELHTGFEHWVETPAFMHLLVAVQQRHSPLFLLGGPGTGKSASLYYLRMRMEPSGQKSTLLQLRPGDSIEQIVLRLGAQMGVPAEQLGEWSSSESAHNARLAALDRQAHDWLILLDDAEFAEEPVGIARLAQRLSESGAIVVIAGRTGFDIPIQQRLPDQVRYRIELLGWDVETVNRYLSGLGHHGSMAPILATMSRMQLNMTPLLLQMVSAFPEGLDAAADKPSELVRSLITRDIERTGSTRLEVEGLLVQLALAGIQGLALDSLAASRKQLASKLTLVTVSGNRVNLGHAAFAKAVLEACELFPPGGIALSSLSFGSEAAERDSLLQANFRDPVGLDELLQGKRTIVVGDRGAGKSALFKTLTSRQASQGSHTILRMEDPIEQLPKLIAENAALSTADQFRAAWLFSLACAIASEVKTRSPEQTQLARTLRETMPYRSKLAEPTGWLNAAGSTLRGWRRALGGSNVKFNVGCVSVEPPKTTRTWRFPGVQVDIAHFLSVTAKALGDEQRQLIVAVDRVDEVHKYQRSIQEPLVQGLLLAEGDTELSGTIHLLVFLRTDLFETCGIQEANKLVSRRLMLEWKTPELLDMLLTRVLSNPQLARIRVLVSVDQQIQAADALRILFPDVVEGLLFEDWLWRGLKNGKGKISPRQLILLLVSMKDDRTIAQDTLSSVPLFGEALLARAMTRVSELSFREARDDFRVAPTLLQNLKAARMTEFSQQEIDHLFEKTEGTLPQQMDLLERLGVVERIVAMGADGKQRVTMQLPPLYARFW